MRRCELCRLKKHDELKFGQFLSHKSVSAHEYCLYLSSGLCQNGEDDKDILGFLLSDIKKEKQRISKVNCCYCGQAYANIGCCAPKCYRNFHLACGAKHGAKFEFISTYKSFCDRHLKAVDKVRPKHDEICCICYDQLWQNGSVCSFVNNLRAPCCRNGWFHKMCLQKYARTAGYFFKCPLCNDANEFRERLCYSGIFIPNKDAEWELEPNAFAELLERPNNCTAEMCISKRTSERNPLVFCETCGSVAIHKLCLFQNEQSSHFECTDCKQMQRNDDSGNSTIRHYTEIQVAEKDGEDDTEIDVCNDSDASETLALENGEDSSGDEDDEEHKFDSKNNSSSEEEHIKMKRLNYKPVILDDSDGIEEDEEEEKAKMAKVHISKTLKRSHVKLLGSDDELENSALLLNDSFSSSDDNTPSTMQLNEPLAGMAKRRRRITDSGDEANVNSSSTSMRTNKKINLERSNAVDKNHNSKDQSQGSDTCSDDDPLENFERCLKKVAQEAKSIDSDNDEINATSFTTQRRRSLPIILDSSADNSSCHSTPTKKEEQPKFKSSTPIRVRCEINQNDTNLHEEPERSQLNTSFIANRTRRKSLYIESSSFATSFTTSAAESINTSSRKNSPPPDDSLSSSCIANRTRRRKSLYLSRIEETNESDSSKSESFHSAVNNHVNSSVSSSNGNNCDILSTSSSATSSSFWPSSSSASSLSFSSSSSNVTSPPVIFSPYKRRQDRSFFRRACLRNRGGGDDDDDDDDVDNDDVGDSDLLSSSDDDENLHSIRRSSRRRDATSTYAAKLPCSLKNFNPYLAPKFTRVNGKLKRHI